MSSKSDICTCKHCGRYLDGEDRALALRIGLDSDECVDQARCFAESNASDAAAVDATNDLYRLRDALMIREADYLQAQLDAADAATLTGDDLFSSESLSSRAIW